MIARELRTTSGLSFISLMLLLSAPAALCQTQQAPPPQAAGMASLQPVSLTHLYWHFLIYQNHLDSVAATMSSQGQDGSELGNDLQRRMGFSDADFAPIRASGVRLSSEIQALDAQAAAIRANGVSPSNTAQLQALTAQREADINAEITSLKQALSPDKITAFETFITQFFAPKPLTVQFPATSGQAAPPAVQQ